jgi:hypothetical protein
MKRKTGEKGKEPAVSASATSQMASAQGRLLDGMDVEEEDKRQIAASPSSVGGAREGEKADSKEGKGRGAAVRDTGSRTPGSAPSSCAVC